MGILGFLKKISGKKEVVVERGELELSEIEERIGSFSENVFGNLNNGLEIIKNKIDEEKKKIKENILLLEEKGIEDKNIPDRGKEIIKGNKKSYSVKIVAFIENINFPKNVCDVNKFCDDFDEVLDNLGKKTAKNFSVIQQFFGNDAKSISISLNKINQLVKDSKKIMEDSNVDGANELKKSFNEINGKIEMEKQLKKKMEVIEDEIKKNGKIREGIRNSIKSIEQGEGYKRFIELNTEKDNFEKELGEVKNRISTDFLYILPTLKKYERLTLDYGVVRDYLENYSKALANDKEFKIADVLDKMKNSIKNGGLELKDKKRDKILKALERMKKIYFKNFIDKSDGLKKSVSKSRLEINKITEVDELGLLKGKLEKRENVAKENNKILEELKNKLESIDINDLKEKLINSHDIFK